MRVAWPGCRRGLGTWGGASWQEGAVALEEVSQPTAHRRPPSAESVGHRGGDDLFLNLVKKLEKPLT